MYVSLSHIHMHRTLEDMYIYVYIYIVEVRGSKGRLTSWIAGWLMVGVIYYTYVRI